MMITTVQYIKIESDYAEQRIDNFLITRLKTMPKSRIYRLLRKGEIRVNKKRVPPSYRLQSGDQIRIPPIRLETAKPIQNQPSQSLVNLLTDSVLYEDKTLLIINKPSGLPVHGGSGVKVGVVETLRMMYPQYPQLELAHRLDCDTSGCLVLAKKRSVVRELHALLREGQVHKEYLALTKGHWKKNELRVTAALQKNHLSSGERIVKIDKEGKASLTVFHPIETYNNASLVKAVLYTGRTHQIRVHAQYRGHNIAGDEKYGDRQFNKEMRQIGLKRLFLHAHLIEFILPSTELRISVSAPLEKELEICLNSLK